ncbi:hypothetical protein [Pedobacter gandavensis]|uniref:Uncharacterized protein n=1 Tax=Pedobacter gandavensis TaxID=2679963 RepID=A0ABR6EUE9_9SPHI|nr:hypothetical protein [Pedobacter gandavensis]MBB2148826.1 hypothetical protein [Pedobacter gandavensis]
MKNPLELVDSPSTENNLEPSKLATSSEELDMICCKWVEAGVTHIERQPRSNCLEWGGEVIDDGKCQ